MTVGTMRRTLAVTLALSLALGSSGCLWFHERNVTVAVENALPRVVRFTVTLDRLAVFGSSVDQLYNETHGVAPNSATDVVIPKVGNGNHALKLWFYDSAGILRLRQLYLSYGETSEDDATRIEVKIRGEDALDMIPIK
ncbi:MAG: hypothetical protein HYT80_00045 [Euryarchaeota archaeon]|nr:hypothetical protein [Euryarchaeota archaeon]